MSCLSRCGLRELLGLLDRGMRILITGGFGFIGGRLGQSLQRQGHDVILGTRQGECNPPVWLPNARVVNTPWSDAGGLKDICAGIDIVVHAAGMNAGACAADPAGAIDFNAVATARLVQAAVAAGVHRLIYLSTVHVYGSPLEGCITEDTCPRNLHPYASSHLAGEVAVLWAAQNSALESVVLRLSNAFGVPLHDRVDCWMLLVNDLCRQLATTGQMVLKSNGTQQRDFIALGKVCSIVGELMHCDLEVLPHRVVNVGSGVSMSVMEMAQLIQSRYEKMYGQTPQISRCDTEWTAGDSLEYHSNILDSLGIQSAGNGFEEIDALLGYCMRRFGGGDASRS